MNSTARFAAWFLGGLTPYVGSMPLESDGAMNHMGATMAKLIERAGLTKTVRSVHLYKDDLDHLMDILGSSYSTRTFTVGEYIYESLDELRQHKGDRHAELKIDAERTDPRSAVEVRFGRYGASVSSFYDKSIVAEISRFLESKVSWRHGLVGWGVFVCVVGTALVVYMLAIRELGQTYSWLVVFLGAIGGFLTTHISSKLCGCRITLIRRHEHAKETFWAKHKEKVIVGVLAALAGVLGKAGVDKWLQHSKDVQKQATPTTTSKP